MMLYFFEDSCWTVSWLLIAIASFRNKKAGFAPHIITLAFAVELFLFYFYTIYTLEPLLKVNYVLWPLTTTLNLIAVYKYSQTEFTAGKCHFWARFIPELILYLVLFYLWGSQLQASQVMLYLGQTVITFISVAFFIRLFTSPELRGQSFSGNVIRVIGGFLCTYINIILRGPETHDSAYIFTMTILANLFDVAYLAVFIPRRFKYK